MERFLCLVLILCGCGFTWGSHTNGEDGRVLSVVTQIFNSMLFASDASEFMYGIALIETLNGENNADATSATFGGVWGCDAAKLAAAISVIGVNDFTAFGGFSATTTLADLAGTDLAAMQRSGICARLYIASTSDAGGNPYGTIAEQDAEYATFWGGAINDYNAFCANYVDANGNIIKDPHIRQSLIGEPWGVCYDIYGEDGAMFKILEDTFHDFKVTLEIFYKGKNMKHGTWIKRIGIKNGNTKIIVDPEGAREDGEKRLLQWQAGDFQQVFKGVRVLTNSTQMVFILPRLLNVTVVLENDHLNFYFDHQTLFVPTLQGFMGDVRRRVRVRQTSRDTAWLAVEDEARDGSYTNEVDPADTLRDGTETLIPAYFQYHCWQPEDKTVAFQDIIQKNRVYSLF